ncbi:MAG: hypothetical protein ACPLRY_03990 [Candidatus Bathyarchaeales archaeon]
MKTAVLALPFCSIFLGLIWLHGFNLAGGYPIVEIPPKVNVTETIVNASISRVSGNLWAKIDAEYRMHAIYAYGDNYLTENYGIGLVLYPDSPFVMVTVTQDILEAHYPIPSGAINISVRLNGKEISVQQDAHGYYHLFDADLSEINWTVSPVPKNFVVTVHYEHPVSETTAAYAYLGDYFFMLPLYRRYGCSNISYPLYSWYGYPPNNCRIQIKSHLPELQELQVYLADSKGTLTPLNYTAFINDEDRSWIIAFSREHQSPIIHGAVAVFKAPSEETTLSPAVPVLAASAIILAAVLIYFAKLKRKMQKGQ